MVRYSIRDRPIYRFTDIFPDILAFYHNRFVKKKISVLIFYLFIIIIFFLHT